MSFILAGVPHVAGSSAIEGYWSARAQRRRGAFLSWVLLVTAGLTGWTGLDSAGILRDLLGLASAACLGLVWLVRPRLDPERWLRGAQGEATTARLLERLPRRQWVVLHDRRIPGSRANLDHLVIGPTGVWLVDTKTTRSEVRARWHSVRFGGRRLDPGPTVWEAEVVTDRLGIPVRPVIAVHGAGLRRRGGRCGPVRVLPAAQLVRHLRRGRRRLGRQQIRALGERAGQVFVPEEQALGRRTISGG